MAKLIQLKDGDESVFPQTYYPFTRYVARGNSQSNPEYTLPDIGTFIVHTFQQGYESTLIGLTLIYITNYTAGVIPIAQGTEFSPRFEVNFSTKKLSFLPASSGIYLWQLYEIPRY